VPCTAASKCTGTTALVFLLAAIVFVSCRSPEPSVGTNGPEKVAALTLPAPQSSASSGHITITPQIVLKEPDLPAANSTVPLPQPSLQQDTPLPIEANTRPRIAIIIDDMGYHQQLGRQFLQLDLNLTYSFLPDAPYTGELTATAFETGREILVHLPMEPKDASKNPGANALLVQDTPERLRQKMTKMLNAVPHAVGANNHMGSRFTEDAEAMQVVIYTLKTRSFFFIDSFTTAGSRGLITAQHQGVPTAPRHVFLDTIREPQQICRQIEQLIAGAKKRGWAIGIGHPNGATLEALSRYNLERFREVEIVGAHQLVQ